MATPITTKDLGINPETGLQEILKVWKVNIEYGRYNHPSNMAFDNWRNSLIGKGIAQAIEGTIVNYPNINQIIEEEEINPEEIKEN